MSVSFLNLVRCHLLEWYGISCFYLSLPQCIRFSSFLSQHAPTISSSEAYRNIDLQNVLLLASNTKKSSSSLDFGGNDEAIYFYLSFNNYNAKDLYRMHLPAFRAFARILSSISRLFSLQMHFSRQNELHTLSYNLGAIKYRTSVDIDSIFVDYNKTSQNKNNTKLHILKFPLEKIVH